MNPLIPYTLLAAAAACGLAFGQAYTTPVGYVTIDCPANSDTIVGLPLRIPAVSAAALSANPEVAGSTATLTFGSAAFTAGAFANTHYVKFVDGPAAGKWFTATANTATTITVDLNGASLAAVSGNRAEVIKFWTLSELFNPAQSTTDPATTGNAIVASTSTLAGGRRTQLFIPNLSGVGINLAPATSYFVHNGIWKRPGQGDASFGSDQLWPDTYFLIRHPAAVTAATKYVVTGEVDTGAFGVSLGTQAAVAQGRDPSDRREGEGHGRDARAAVAVLPRRVREGRDRGRARTQELRQASGDRGAGVQAGDPACIGPTNQGHRVAAAARRVGGRRRIRGRGVIARCRIRRVGSR